MDRSEEGWRWRCGRLEIVSTFHIEYSLEDLEHMHYTQTGPGSDECQTLLAYRLID